MSAPQFGPSIELTRLWQKTSQKTGAVYYVGRLAGARVTILPNRNKVAETDHDMVVLLSQADAAPKPSPTPGPSLPFPDLAPDPPPAEVPPWEDHPPRAASPFQPRQPRPGDRFKKPPPRGQKTKLVDNEMPF
jgi:hypothetical protein